MEGSRYELGTFQHVAAERKSPGRNSTIGCSYLDRVMVRHNVID